MSQRSAIALSLAVMVGMLPLAARAQTAAATRPFAPADLFKLRRAGDVRISPDGSKVAYVRSSSDIAIDGNRDDVMIVTVADGGERLVARDAAMPRWSPDGRTLAYVANGTHVVLQPIAGGASIRFDVPGGAATLRWSPDGRRLAYTAFVAEPAATYVPPVAKPVAATWAAAPRIITGAPYQQDGQPGFDSGHVQLFVIDADGSGRQQLTSAATDVDGEPAWTADGSALIYSAQPVDFRQHIYTKARLFRIAATGGTALAISPDDIGARSPAISPDGRTIAFVGARRTGRDYEPGAIYLMQADGRSTRLLAPRFDAEASAPTFSADGRSVFAIHPDRGTTVLTRFDLDGTPHVAVRGIGGDTGYSVAVDGTIAFPSGGFDHPADVTVAITGGRERVLTSLNEALLGDRRLATIKPLSFHSALDGAEIGAWVVCPPGRTCQNLPLILMIHGGPYGYDDPSWNSEDQLLATSGYAILHVNYRGSLGYGFAFADRIARDYPNPSYVDLMSGVDAAIAAGIADRDHLFVAGGSAGGMLAAWTIGRTDRFKAAAVVKPVINEISDALVTDQFASLGDAVGALPWDDPMAYWRRSPLSLVGHVTTPTLVMVGEEDHRTPIGEAQQFFNALQLLGVASQLAVFPGAGHASIYGTPSRLIAGVALQLDWFARHGGQPIASAIATP
jgi:dipeptidyl aminopeptidase/acylaminoacyl peptidase